MPTVNLELTLNEIMAFSDNKILRSQNMSAKNINLIKETKIRKNRLTIYK
jgi:hypothetical protein